MNTKIPARKLGTLEVSAIGLGCMGMTFSYAPLGDVGVSRLAVYY